MKVIIIDDNNTIVVRTVEDTAGLEQLQGRFRVVRRGSDGDETATPWLSSESAIRRLHFEASLLGLYVRDLRAYEEDQLVLFIEADRLSVSFAWKLI